MFNPRYQHGSGNPFIRGTAVWDRGVSGSPYRQPGRAAPAPRAPLAASENALYVFINPNTKSTYSFPISKMHSISCHISVTGNMANENLQQLQTGRQ